MRSSGTQCGKSIKVIQPKYLPSLAEAGAWEIILQYFPLALDTGKFT